MFCYKPRAGHFLSPAVLLKGAYTEKSILQGFTSSLLVTETTENIDTQQLFPLTDNLMSMLGSKNQVFQKLSQKSIEYFFQLRGNVGLTVSMFSESVTAVRFSVAFVWPNVSHSNIS